MARLARSLLKRQVSRNECAQGLPTAVAPSKTKASFGMKQFMSGDAFFVFAVSSIRQGEECHAIHATDR
jgi:hypothetical protein